MADKYVYPKIIQYLKKSVDEEIMARKAYIDRALVARSVGDLDTANLFEHIAGEEEQHAIEFSQRVLDLKPEESKLAETAECLISKKPVTKDDFIAAIKECTKGKEDAP
ncbi:MAG: hypothetical protein PHI12_08505 [Dehalococcoidales bacterium]|nr:hypothetical protein [Dehalococcoidales bacterium]